MNIRLQNIIGILFSTIILSGCSIYGTYKNRFNDGYGAGWIKINPDNSFEYITWGHMTGYGYTKGLWKKQNDSIYLTEFEPKIPKTNQIIEINNVEKKIKIVGKDSKPLLPYNIKINGVLDSIKSDWNGNYSYKKFKKINRIQVFNLGNTKDEIGQLIADFKPNCNTCSYKIIIDLDRIGFKSVFNLDSIWIHKRNRLYPIDSSVKKLSNGKIIYYKKTDTVKPFNLWINSWDNMKNGFE